LILIINGADIEYLIQGPDLCIQFRRHLLYLLHAVHKVFIIVVEVLHIVEVAQSNKIAFKGKSSYIEYHTVDLPFALKLFRSAQVCFCIQIGSL